MPPRKLTPEHKARMAEGRRRSHERRRREQDKQREAFSRWVRRDARLWRAYMNAIDGDNPDEIRKARNEWRSNLADMPSIGFGESEDKW